jgi:ribosomal protein S15P/S13E
MKKAVFFLLVTLLVLGLYKISPSQAQTEIRPNVTIVLSFSGSDRYPGGTVKFNIVMTNSGTTPDAIDNVTLMTPWQTYSKLNILRTLSPGEAYLGSFNVTIPVNQPTGDVEMLVKTSSRYLIGQFWAKFDNVSSTYTLKILPNPYELETELKDSQSKVSSLEDQLSTMTKNANDLSKTVASLQKDNQNKTTRIQNLEAELNQIKISLSNVSSQLSSTQSQLNAYSLYLPIGVAIPSIIALVLAILMLRGRSK